MLLPGVVLVVLAVVQAAAATNGTTANSEGWHLIEGECLKVFSELKNWTDATDAVFRRTENVFGKKFQKFISKIFMARNVL